MKKSIITLGVIGCMLTGCINKAQEANTMCEQQENQVINTIMERRSIRKYKPQAVERDKMDIILKCGINAPNGQNKQSWEVRVVDNPELMEAMKEAMAKGRRNCPQRCFRCQP